MSNIPGPWIYECNNETHVFVQSVCFISKRILLRTIQALGNLRIK